MKRALVFIVTLSIMAVVLVACSTVEQAMLDAAAGSGGAAGPSVTQAPTAVANVEPVGTPEFSGLVSPTPLPTMGGPLGTLTAISDLVASPTQNREPYIIVNRGNPHFIEFHAWW
ncbi:MAG: hypothetical protein K8S97_10075 [Anaerolineae bacterium]|nr:hypothetical protein [Anaerolineae bacterium]